MNKGLALCKARAAGMASATRGRARTFRDRSREDDGGVGEIREGLEARKEREAREAEDWAEWDANRRASEPDEDQEPYADWEW